MSLFSLLLLLSRVSILSSLCRIDAPRRRGTVPNAARQLMGWPNDCLNSLRALRRTRRSSSRRPAAAVPIILPLRLGRIGLVVEERHSRPPLLHRLPGQVFPLFLSVRLRRPPLPSLLVIPPAGFPRRGWVVGGVWGGVRRRNRQVPSPTR